MTSGASRLLFDSLGEGWPFVSEPLHRWRSATALGTWSEPFERSMQAQRRARDECMLLARPFNFPAVPLRAMRHASYSRYPEPSACGTFTIRIANALRKVIILMRVITALNAYRAAVWTTISHEGEYQLDRIRTFHDPATGKAWGTRVDGLNAILVSGVSSKTKEIVKPQTDEAAMQRFLEKEEGERLRKGMLLADPHAAPGAPCMLRHLGRGNTGALAITEFDGCLLVNQFDDAGRGDALLQIARDGVAQRLTFVGENTLVWKLIAVPKLNKVLFRADHQVRSWEPLSNSITALTQRNKTPASFLDCQGTLAAWHEEPELVVHDLATGRKLLRLKVEPELYSGHSPQLTGALSDDGSMLAHCAQAGKILVHDVASGTHRFTVSGAFEMVSKLAFTPDNRQLIVKERYGRWGLTAFELATGKPAVGWPDLNDLGESEFAIDNAHERLAFCTRGRAYVYEWPTMRKHCELRIDQVARSAALAWTSDGLLAVRTDLGCVGLYRVE